MEVAVTHRADKGGAWQEVVRKVAALWEGPLPRRPATRDPHEIDKFYVQRYAPRKPRGASTSRSRETV